jgi:hypothetical protein
MRGHGRPSHFLHYLKNGKNKSSVKIFEAAEFESETAGRVRSNLPKNVIGRADSLQNGFVILSAQR